MNKVDPIFKLLKTPLCYEGGKFSHCSYDHDNERRLEGKDKLPPCCIWIQKVKAPSTVGGIVEVAGQIKDRKAFERAQQDMVDYYGKYILEED